MSGRNGQTRCAIYTRKSSDENLHLDLNSLDAQRMRAESFIASMGGEGWVCLPDRYDDPGYSGGNAQRPALKRLLADIEKGLIDVVVVYRLDRLSRCFTDFARMLELFEEHDVAFTSVTEQFNTSTAGGRVFMQMLLMFAQYERELASERTRHKIESSRRNGLWTGGRPILGYDIDRQPGGSRLIVNEDEAEMVRAIFTLYLERLGLVEVAKELNERGISTKRWTTKDGRRMGGRDFDKSSVYAILTNVAYTGKIRHHDAVYDGQHEAIIDEALWREVQARLVHNGRSGCSEARNKYGAILRGLLHCSACGSKMTHSFSKKNERTIYRYYTCLSAQKKGWHTCPNKSVPAPEIERFILAQIRAIGEDEDLCTATINQLREITARQSGELLKEQRRLQRQLQRDATKLTKAIDGDHRADLLERSAAAERRLHEIEEELRRLQSTVPTSDEVVGALAEFDALWEVLAPRERARLIALLIERILYDRRSGTIQITYHPTALRALQGEIEKQRSAAA